MAMKSVIGRSASHLPLDRDALVAKIRQRQLKQWWIAEQLKVSKLTVLRWVNGQVRRVKREHLESLAELLTCDLQELVSFESSESFEMSPQDHAEALRAIHQDDLYNLLDMKGKHKLYESIARGLYRDGIPLTELAELYDRMATAVYNQQRFDESLLLTVKVREIADRIGDKNLLASSLAISTCALAGSGRPGQALKNLAQLADIRDNLSEEEYSRHAFVEVIPLIVGFDFERAIATALRYEAFFGLRHELVPQAILSYYRGHAHQFLEQWAEAKQAFEMCLSHAQGVEFETMICEARVGLARVALEKDKDDEAAAALLALVQEKSADIARVSLSYYVTLAALARARGELDVAGDLLKKAARQARHYPFGLAHTYFERHQLAMLAAKESATKRLKKAGTIIRQRLEQELQTYLTHSNLLPSPE